MLEKMSITRISIARVLMIMMLIVGAFPLISTNTYSAKSTKTTNETTESTEELEDINVSIKTDNSGKSKLDITGMDGDGDSSFNKLFSKSKTIVTVIAGMAFLIFLAMFIINCTSVAVNSKNPNARGASVSACVWTGIAMAVCGSATLICALSWNALK